MTRPRTKSRARRAPAAPSRDQSARATREALIAAGTELFAEQGLDAPSLDAICERAGYTRGAFYVHFADRDAFLDAVMERVGGEFLDAVLGSSVESAGGLGDIASRFVGAVARGDYPLMRGGGVRFYQLLDACARSSAVRARYTGLVQKSLARIEQVASFAQLASGEGALRGDVAPAQVATVVLSAVLGAQTMMELGVQVDLFGAASALLAMLAPAAAPATTTTTAATAQPRTAAAPAPAHRRRAAH